MTALWKWLRDNSLSLLFFCFFALSLGGESIAGYYSWNERLAANHKPALRYADYLTTGNFLDSIFVNWQGALLQLGCLIVFDAFLRQKGAAHSRKRAGSNKRNDRGQGHSWAYRNSLSLAFAALFCATFVAHLFFGDWACDETRALTGGAPLGVLAYLASAQCWFKAVQTWQAEFGAIFLYLVLSIFLRQQGSAESKPTDSSNAQTGETNK